MHRVEFTIEPFRDGDPGPHVTEAITAARDLGVAVEVGPFGSACAVDGDLAADVVAAIVRAALANGADHVNIDVDADGAGHPGPASGGGA